MDRLNYYTKGQVKRILDSLVFLVDTREKENAHILRYFQNKHKIYAQRALASGDYSVMIPPDAELGIDVPITFNKPVEGGVYIERKGSLEELAGNLGRLRDRFESELERMKNAEKHLIVEGGSWTRILAGDYNAKVSKESYYHSLLTFQTRYGLHIHFVPKENCGALICGILENKIKEFYAL